MKKLFILTILLYISVAFSTNVLAQRKCGTMEYLQKQKAADATLEPRMLNYEEALQKWIQNNQNYINSSKATITVPVVVHIVYNLAGDNISDARVLEQIGTLNTDYAGLNTHSMSAFSPSLKINTEIQFCLAQRKPDGSATNGIERRQTTVTSFTDDDAVKYYATGGLDAWDPNKYLNIWVCNLVSGLYGYAQFPTTGINATYGVVIGYKYFGITGAVAPYNLGGTTAHELGHCFNLYHIWGDDLGFCFGTDYCNDVPNQANYTNGAPTGVLTDACTAVSPGIMYMNFMDYTDDIALANFTPDQKARIAALFATGGLLNSLATSDGCTPSTSCGTPTGLNATNITTTTATLNWNAMAGANSYNIQYRKVGTTPFTSTTSATNSKAITGLTALTNYEFKVQAVCFVTGSYSSLSNFWTGCPDNYEANNTLATGKSIAVNTPITALIGAAGDIDYFKFNSTTTLKNIKITLTNLPADYDVQLYKSNGTLLKTSANRGTTNETIIYNKAAAATYYIKVYGYNGAYNATSCYTLTAFISASAYKGIIDEETEAEFEAAMLLFPNPANDNLKVNYTAPSEAAVSIGIYDVTGRLVSSIQNHAVRGFNSYTMDVTHLSKGFYVLTLDSDGERLIEKLIIEK